MRILNTVLLDNSLQIVDKDTSVIEAFSSLQQFQRVIAPYSTEWIPYLIFYPTNEQDNVGIPTEYLLVPFVETTTYDGQTYYVYEKDFPPVVLSSKNATSVKVSIAFVGRNTTTIGADTYTLIGIQNYDETNVTDLNGDTVIDDTDLNLYIAAQLLIDFPSAVANDVVRVFNTETDWKFNGTAWVDQNEKLLLELEEHRSVEWEYTIRKGTSTSRPTHAPNNTETIIAELNKKINATTAYDVFYQKTEVDQIVSDGLNLKVNRSGDDMTGTLDMNNNALDKVSSLTLYDPSGNAVAVYNGTDIVFTYRNVQAELFKNLFVEVKADEAIANGDVVQYTGQVGVSGRVRIKKAVPSEVNANPSLIVGIATHAIASGQNDLINWYGAINGLDTSSFTAGDTIYFASESGVSGQYTNVKPIAPNVQVKLGIVSIVSATQGQIKIRPEIGTALADLHDVYLNGHTLQENDILKYDFTNKRWTWLNLDTFLDTRVSNLVESASLNPTTYVLTFTRDNGTTFAIDLPIEQLIVSGTYDVVNRDIILTLDNGNKIVIPVDDIFVGLATQTWVNTQLANYYTQAQVNTIAQAKIDLDLGNPEITTITDMVATDLIYVYRASDGTYKRISWSALLGDITTETGSFSPIATYEDLTAGKAYSTAQHTLTKNVDGDYYASVGGAMNGYIYNVKMPSASETTTFRVSLDGASGTYINVTVGGVNVQTANVSDKFLELYYDGANFTLFENGIVSTEAPYIGTTNHFDTPKNGIDLAIGKKSVTVPENVKGLTYEQIVSNGDFSINDVTDFINVGSTSVYNVSGYLDNTGSGSTTLPRTYKETLTVGISYFIKARVRVTNALSSEISIRNSAGVYINKQLTPTQNQWYELEGLITATSNQLLFAHSYNSTNDANGAVMQIDYVYAIPVPTILSSYTDSQLSTIFPTYISQGLHTLGESGEIPFSSVGDNLFDKSQYTSVDYEYLVPIKPNVEYTWSESVGYKLYDYNQNEIASGTANTVTSTNAYYIAFDNTIASLDTFALNKGTSVVYSDYESNNGVLYTPNGLRSVGSVYDTELVKRIGVETGVSIGATINDTTITTISSTSDFIAVDETNGEVQYGTYGDTLTLTNTATVYYVLATYEYRTIDIDGQLTITPKGLFIMQDSNGVMNEVDLTVAQDVNAQVNIGVDTDIRLGKEIQEAITEIKEFFGGYPIEIYSATEFVSVTRQSGTIYGEYNESTGVITWYFGNIGA